MCVIGVCKGQMADTIMTHGLKRFNYVSQGFIN